MAEIVAVARIVANSGEKAEVAAAIDALAQQSRQESGCVSYEVFHNVNDDSDVLIYEIWRSHEDLAAHGKAPHMSEFKEVVRGRAAISVERFSRS